MHGLLCTYRFRTNNAFFTCKTDLERTLKTQRLVSCRGLRLFKRSISVIVNIDSFAVFFIFIFNYIFRITSSLSSWIPLIRRRPFIRLSYRQNHVYIFHIYILGIYKTYEFIQYCYLLHSHKNKTYRLMDKVEKI